MRIILLLCILVAFSKGQDAQNTECLRNISYTSDHITIDEEILYAYTWGYIRLSGKYALMAFCPILLFFQIIILSLFSKFKSLRAKPGDIFFALVFIETFLNIHLIVSVVYEQATYSYFSSVPRLPVEGNYPPSLVTMCKTFGFLSTFFEINHLCYLFIFLFYIIFLFRFSLKKKSQNFWWFFRGSAGFVCLGITIFLYFDNFIGLNLYGVCGMTSLIRKSNNIDWGNFLPVIGLVCSTAFLMLGIFTTVYFNKHMPDQGELKRRKEKNSKIIMFFVIGFSCFQIFTGAIGLTTNIQFCNLVKTQTETAYFQTIFQSLVTVVNIVRPLEYTFTILLILWNDRFRRKFKIFLKRPCICFSKPVKKVSQTSFSDDSKSKQQQEIEMKAMYNEKLLHIKDGEEQIDILLLSQIYTIVSGVYLFLFQYFGDNQPKNVSKNTQTTNFGLTKQVQIITEQTPLKINQQVRPFHFQESITLQINDQLMRKYESKDRSVISLKTLKCMFTMHCPKVFRKMLQLDNLKKVHQSFNLFDNIHKIWKVASDGQGGKSGEFFFFSKDRKWVLKTINPMQFQFLKQNLHLFYEYYSTNRKSVLAKIYGLFTVKGDEMQRTYRLILMKNMMGCYDQQIKRVYDLKGSTYDRKVLDDEEQQQINEMQKRTLKDLDFKNIEGERLKLSQKQAKQLKETIQKDATFLRQLRLIDYSLLVVRVKWEQEPVQPEFWSKLQRISSNQKAYEYYHIGIIDYLQLWDFQKKSESCWKKMTTFNNTQISSANPVHYCDRFVKYVQKICQFSESAIKRKDSYKSSQMIPLGAVSFNIPYGPINEVQMKQKQKNQEKVIKHNFSDVTKLQKQVFQQEQSGDMSPKKNVFDSPGEEDSQRENINAFTL